MEEKWYDIKGFEGLYQITLSGKVKSLDRVYIGKNGRNVFKAERMRKISISNGYPVLELFNHNGVSKNSRLHRLIALTFIPNPDNLPIINHKDGNKLNFSLDNLEWCTPLQNIRHALATGLNRSGRMLGRSGALNPKSKPLSMFSLEGEWMGDFANASCVSRKYSDINPCYVHRVCTGLQPSHKGYVFKYINK